MGEVIDDAAIATLFLEARTHTAWRDKPVTDEQLRTIYHIMKFGPTSANCCPAHIVFVRSTEAKKRLLPALSPTNVDKTMSAPVTAIVAFDLKFYDNLPKLFPHMPTARDWFAGSQVHAETTAFRNGSLQGGYFILAARAVGLDCGPMSGFDNAKLDAEFFPASGEELNSETDAMPLSRYRSNFLCNLGYGDASKLFPRNPRLEFDEACTIL